MGTETQNVKFVYKNRIFLHCSLTKMHYAWYIFVPDGGNIAAEARSVNNHHSQPHQQSIPGTKYLYVLELTHQRPVFGSGGRFRLLANGSLVIRNVGETDEGNYLCEADNGVNEPLGKVVKLKVNGRSNIPS